MAAEAEQTSVDFDTDEDRYTTQESALRQLLDHQAFPMTQVDRIEIGFLANGEVTVRWREQGLEEYDGIVLSAES